MLWKATSLESKSDFSTAFLLNSGFSCIFNDNVAYKMSVSFILVALDKGLTQLDTMAFSTLWKLTLLNSEEEEQ